MHKCYFSVACQEFQHLLLIRTTIIPRLLQLDRLQSLIAHIVRGAGCEVLMSGICSCSHVLLKHTILHHCVLISTPSSSILFASNLTFPVMIKRRNCFKVLFLSLHFKYALPLMYDIKGNFIPFFIFVDLCIFHSFKYLLVFQINEASLY